jgi:hypothetical protein
MQAEVQPQRSSPSGLDRWVAVGSSLNPDLAIAVRESLAQVLAHGEPRLTIIFCSPALDSAEVARLVGAAVGESKIIGCTTAGELRRHQATSGGLLIWALGGEGFSVTTGLGVGDPATGLREAAHQAALCLNQLPPRQHTLLLLLADGLCGDQMEVVRGAYEVSGANVPLVGGCAADDMALHSTRQIHGSEVHTHAVVAAAIGSDAPMAVGIAHGWEPFGEAMLVTRSHDTTLVTLDDLPALDVYFDAYGAPAEVRQDPASFFDFAHTRPIGIVRRDRMEIRYVYGADYGQRTITIFAEVPQGARPSSCGAAAHRCCMPLLRCVPRPNTTWGAIRPRASCCWNAWPAKVC